MDVCNFPAAQNEILKDIEVVEIEKLKSSMDMLYSVWNEIGLDADQKRARVHTAWSHIQVLLTDICDEEIALCEDIKQRIKDNMEEISELSRLLSVQQSHFTGLTLLEREEKLREQLENLKSEKERRIKELKELRSTEHRYSIILAIEEYKLSSTTEAPSIADLRELEQHIQMLQVLYNKKYEKFCQARKQLSTIFEETELTPETLLEKQLYEGKEPLSLSDVTFVAIDEILHKAQLKKADLEAQKKFLIEKLLVLWRKLGVESSKQTEFLSHHSDCKSRTLNSIQQELLRCEELKRQNMTAFIDATRKELDDLWVKCAVSDSVKENFSFYFSPEMSEIVLAAHEAEVEKWKKYYLEVKFILEKIEKRNELWDLLAALDSKASDPARFKNRGGNLLREERERSKLHKTLPALEAEINQAIDTYEKENGKNFLYLGFDYRSLISEQWQKRLRQKENVKKENFVTPSKKPKMATPKSAPCTRTLRYPTPSNVRTTVKKVKKLPASCRKPPKNVLYEIDLNTPGPTPKDTAVTTPKDETGYSAFAEELDRTHRRGFRSSAVLHSKVKGGTRPSITRKRKSGCKHPETPDKDHPDLASVRGKSGLPFLM